MSTPTDWKVTDSLRNFKDAEGENLLALVGTTLKSAWGVWSLQFDEWWSGEPVILIFENKTLWINWLKFNELRYKWDDFDPASDPLSHSEYSPKVWRRTPTPELSQTEGLVVSDVWLSDAIVDFGRAVWVFNGLLFELDRDDSWLLVYNGLDENAVSSQPDDVASRRTSLSTGQVVNRFGATADEPKA